MIVVDASVLLPALVDSAGGGALARTVLASDEQRHTPHLVDVEVLAGIRGWWRAGHLTQLQAREALADLAAFPLTRHPHGLLLGRAFDLRENLTAYDACYVALAELLDATLVTADAGLAAAPALRCAVRLLRS